MALQPLMSRAWSCESLKNGLASVYDHHARLAQDDLSEQEMVEEVAVSWFKIQTDLVTGQIKDNLGSSQKWSHLIASILRL